MWTIGLWMDATGLQMDGVNGLLVYGYMWFMGWVDVSTGLWVGWMYLLVYGLGGCNYWFMGWVDVSTGLWVEWMYLLVYGLGECIYWFMGCVDVSTGLWVGWM